MKYDQDIIVVWGTELSLKSAWFLYRVHCNNAIGRSVVGQMSTRHMTEILN